MCVAQILSANLLVIFCVSYTILPADCAVLLLRRLPYPLALLSYVGASTVDYARNMIEWMSDEVQKEFNTSNTNPLQTPHFK
jgi:hypothetical protein